MASSDFQIIPNQAEPDSPLLAVSLSHILKLTPTNYISWKTQIEATLLGLDLYKFIDGSHPPPPHTVTTTTTKTPTTTESTEPAKAIVVSTTITNPAYTTWFRQDKLLLSALAGTLSPSLVPLISLCPTTIDAWNTLSKTYANPSKGHLKQLKDRLRNITKGSRSISDYMQDIKSCTDQLSSLGRPLDPDDIVDKILDQLNDSDYDSVISAVQNRETPISFDELHEKLITKELSLKQKSSSSTSFPSSVHYVAKNTNRNSNPKFPNTSAGLLPNPRPNFSAPNTRPNTPYLGKCQWCRTQGHSLTFCPMFRSQYPHIPIPNFTPNPSSGPPNHSPRPSYRGQNNHHTSAYTPRPTAYTATTQTSLSPAWLLDSGATNHATNDLNNLALHSPYDGTEELLIGDGSGLQISNIGSASLSTPHSSVKLNNVLHVPMLSRNIISISQFCLDNNSSITFSPNSYVVKDLKSGTILLQGQPNSGVYEWHPFSSAVHSVNLSSNIDWHHRLGHPSPSILRFLSQNFSLNIPSSSSFHCNSCDCNKSHKLPFYVNSIKSFGPLDVIYSDVWTSPISSFDSFKYYIIFVDHFSKYIWFYPLKHKNDATSVFSHFKLLVEKYFNRSIKTIFSDNGGEYIGLQPLLKSTMAFNTSLLLPIHRNIMVILSAVIGTLSKQV